MSFFTWGLKLGSRKTLGETSELHIGWGSVLEIWIQVLGFLLWLHSLQRRTHSTCDQESNLKSLPWNAVHRSSKHVEPCPPGYSCPPTDLPACTGSICKSILEFKGNGAESTIPQPELVWITKLLTGLASGHLQFSKFHSSFLLFALFFHRWFVTEMYSSRCFCMEFFHSQALLKDVLDYTFACCSQLQASIVGQTFSNFAFQNSSFQESHSFWSCNARNQTAWRNRCLHEDKGKCIYLESFWEVVSTAWRKPQHQRT